MCEKNYGELLEVIPDEALAYFEKDKNNLWLAKNHLDTPEAMQQYVNRTTAAIAQQIHAFLFQTKVMLTARGGSGYANREDELRKIKGYEEEIDEENRGISY